MKIADQLNIYDFSLIRNDFDRLDVGNVILSTSLNPIL